MGIKASKFRWCYLLIRRIHQIILKKFAKKCFFGGKKGDFTIKKANFPKNTLVYWNQVTISTLKAEDYAVYILQMIRKKSYQAHFVRTEKIFI